MKKLVFACSILIFFLFISVLLVRSTSLFLNLKVANAQSSQLFYYQSRNLVSSPINGYYASLEHKGRVVAVASNQDSRPIIIDNFLAANQSPMVGLGNFFVQTADKYQLDWRLLPAIAFQESTLGKNMPAGSHNAFGWAIYTGADSGARFHNWEFAIETVAQGLKKDYVDKGLTSVDAIMSRYTPDSNGSWAFGVKFAMNEMSSMTQ